MDLPKLTQRLRAVAYALGNVEVKGRDNMDIMLGTMQEIDRIAAALDKLSKETEAPMPQPQVVVEEVAE